MRDQYQNLLATNELGRAFYAPLIGDGEGGRIPNLARFQFLDPASRDFYPDWDRFAEMCCSPYSPKCLQSMEFSEVSGRIRWEAYGMV